MRTFFLIIVSVVTLSACTTDRHDMQAFDKSFVKVHDLISTSVLQEELILGRPLGIHYADSSILIYDDLSDTLFILIDLVDDGKVYRFGQRGESENEFLQVFSFCSMDVDSLVGVYDVYRRCLCGINLRQVKREPAKFPIITKDTLNSIVLAATKYGTYLGLGFYENNMLSLSGDEIGRKFFFEYPYQDSREQMIANRLRGMAYQGPLCSNKSLDKFLYAVGSAPIFMLYSVTEDEIKKTYEWIGGYPVYVTEETGEYRSAPMSADNKQSFIAAYATDNYVYLLYSGKSVREANRSAFQGNTIYRLTWKGEPVDKFELDFPATKFCVSDADDTLYALVNKGEVELVQYALK